MLPVFDRLLFQCGANSESASERQKRFEYCFF